MHGKSIILGMVISTAIMVAQEREDTTVYQFPEVVVTATRSRIPLQDSPSPVEVIQVLGKPDQAATVADVMRTAHGTFLNNLGGSGALKTVFLRGTSPQHLLVLLNGVRLNSMQNGLVDMSLLPLNDVDRIEVVRGGSSALYGADALGGVVNILTRQARPGTRLRGEAGVGTFGYNRWLVEAEGGYEIAGVLAGVSYEQGRDDFPFPVRTPAGADSTATRRNADFRKFQGYIHGSVPLTDGSELQVSSRFATVRRGVPGPLSFPSPLARQDDDDILANAGYRNADLGSVEFQLRSSFHRNIQNYRDPNPLFPTNVTYRNTFLFLNPEILVSIGRGARTLLGVEVASGSLKGDDFEGTIERTQRSAYLSQEATWDFHRSWFDRLFLFGMIRYDAISDVGNAFMPKVGFNMRLLRQNDIRLRGSIGASFRAPSFNDLYYIGVNNPDLRPERSTSIDAGVTSTINAGGVHTIELTFFEINARERILFDLALFKPVNIGRTRSRGVEVKYVGSFLDESVRVEVAHTLTDARKRHRSFDGDPTFDKRLPFIPRESGHVRTTISWDPLSLFITESYVGRRFVTEDNTSSLPPFFLTEVGIGAAFDASGLLVSVNLDVQNVFNRVYEVFPNYPMPGRTIRLTAGIRY